MLSIRKGMFETNSSSCHKLIAPADQSYTIPKVVDFDRKDTDGLAFLYDMFETRDYYIELWIPFLYANGVEEIIYTGDNIALKGAIEEFKGTTEVSRRPDLPSQGNEVLPNTVYLSIIFGEDTFYMYNAYDDEREPEEKDGRHFVFIWR